MDADTANDLAWCADHYGPEASDHAGQLLASGEPIRIDYIIDPTGDTDHGHR